MSTFVTVVGLAAAVCTTGANLPQLKKAWTSGGFPVRYGLFGPEPPGESVGSVSTVSSARDFSSPSK